jgi:hemolysin activation/secretion protein
LGLNYQPIRQRQKNLTLIAKLESTDVVSDIALTPLTRDHVRILRADISYDSSDRWNGYNFSNLIISRGINGLGSSQKGDLNLSRDGAAPNFTKAELSLSRLQGINNDWSVFISAAGQWASGVMYSSEQFGYGGQNAGRAFDSSEITGDNGFTLGAEFRYYGLRNSPNWGLQPYFFYDAGTVWNRGSNQPSVAFGSSAGCGVRADYGLNLKGNLGIAWPISRQKSSPNYGLGPSSPRLLLQLSRSF